MATQIERPMYKAILSAYQRLFVVDCQMRKIVQFLEKNDSKVAKELAAELKKCEESFTDRGDFLEGK